MVKSSGEPLDNEPRTIGVEIAVYNLVPNLICRPLSAASPTRLLQISMLSLEAEPLTLIYENILAKHCTAGTGPHIAKHAGIKLILLIRFSQSTTSVGPIFSSSISQLGSWSQFLVE